MTSNELKNIQQSSLPLSLRRNIDALVQLQRQSLDVESEFHRKLFELECEFNEKRIVNYAKRCDIINGKHTPTIDECKMRNNDSNDENDNDNDAIETIKGVPNFWLVALKNCSFCSICECDEAPLQYLVDIQLEMNVLPTPFYRFSFQFATNPFFVNSTLTKTYLVDFKPDDDALTTLWYEGATVFKTEGCSIEWHKDMNIAEKYPASFFNFFDPPKPDANIYNEFVDIYDVNEDFNIGLRLKERLVPNAVTFFLGSSPIVSSNYTDSESSSTTSDDDDDDDALDERLTEHTNIV